MKISYENALEIISNTAKPLGVVKKPLLDCLHHVLAKDVVALISQPPFPRSPLDGYAFAAESVCGATEEKPIKLSVIDAIYAGDDATNICIGAGQAVRIMTGAMIPKGADCVIRQEDVTADDNFVSVFQTLKPFENYCPIGEDFRAGDLLLKAGTVLDPSAIAALASAGVTEAIVYEKPKIAIISTGSEIVAPGCALTPGKIYNSNQYLLASRLKEWGLNVTYMNTCKDTAEEISTALSEAAKVCDVIITTGGVSVGEKDLIPDVVQTLHGTTYFHGVKIKPGMPVLYGSLLGKPLLALSGNPFAACVSLEVLGKMLLYRMAGYENYELCRCSAVLTNAFPKGSKVRRFLRGNFDVTTGLVTIPSAQSNGVIRSMSGCNCLLDIPSDSDALESGQRVTVILLNQ